MPGSTGLGEPRQGTHLSMLRTTHPPLLGGSLVLPIYGEVAPKAPEGLVGTHRQGGGAATLRRGR